MRKRKEFVWEISEKEWKKIMEKVKENMKVRKEEEIAA